MGWSFGPSPVAPHALFLIRVRFQHIHTISYISTHTYRVSTEVCGCRCTPSLLGGSALECNTRWSVSSPSCLHVKQQLMIIHFFHCNAKTTSYTAYNIENSIILEARDLHNDFQTNVASTHSTETKHGSMTSPRSIY